VNAAAPARPYVVAGLIMGGVWAFNAGAPIAEHAVRFGFLLFVIAPILFEVYKRRMRVSDPALPKLSFWRVMAAKAAVLCLALVASAVLARWMDADADYVVAAGIVTVFAVAGPRIHAHLLVREPAVAPA
jgi:hypothetical protein